MFVAGRLLKWRGTCANRTRHHRPRLDADAIPQDDRVSISGASPGGAAVTEYEFACMAFGNDPRAMALHEQHPLAAP